MRHVSLRFIKDPLLRRLIPGTGSAVQARNELRWIKQEVSPEHLTRVVTQRSHGIPLQYILGSQPFGALEIKCRPGVLIPRWETEEWVTELAERAEGYLGSGPLRVLDIGTGTGCILFLLCSLLPKASGTAMDVSPAVINLFNENRASLDMATRTQIVRHDLHTPFSRAPEVDLVVSNPPYITKLADADAQVRKHEPVLALLEQPDIYEHLVKRVFETSARMAVFEVGNEQQIELCVRLFSEHGWNAWGQRDSAGNWRTVWATKSANSVD